MSDETLTFINPWRQYKPGDPVPANLDHGTVDALQRRGVIGRKECRPERDKMVRRAKRTK